MRRGALLCTLLLLPPLWGCEDAMGPEGSNPSFAGLPLDLATTASLGAIVAPDGRGEDWGRAWRESWTNGSAEGRALRASLREEVALAATKRDAEAERLRAHALIQGMEVLVGAESAAGRAMEPAKRAVARAGSTDGTESWVLLLEASDALLSIEPSMLLESLLDCDGRDGRRNPGADPYSELMNGRAEHLRVGARMAMLEDNLGLAVRRAFYGCRLLAEHGTLSKKRE